MTKLRVSKRTIAKWVEALRSGEFEQGRNAMNNEDNSYCCLGVACKVLIPLNKQKLFADGILVGNLPCHSEQPNAPKWLKKVNEDFGALAGRALSDLNDLSSFTDDGERLLSQFTFDEIAEQLELAYIHGAYD
jgi:hypothetical protein